MKENIVKKATAYVAYFIYNAQMPRNIKKGKSVEEVPFSVAYVKHVLEKNGIEASCSTNRHFTIKGENKDEVLKIANKIKELFKDNQLVSTVIHGTDEQPYKKVYKKLPGHKHRTCILVPIKPKKKRPSGNKEQEKRPCSKYKQVPKKPKILTNLKSAYKKKSHSEAEAIQYTVDMFNDKQFIATLSKSQLKRALNRVAIITFVNKMCNKKFSEYTETMKFVRSACSDSFDVASVAKGGVNSERVIQLSADKTDGAKVITFKEKIIMKDAA